MCYIKQFEGLETGRVTAKVVEGRVNKVKVIFVDDEGNEKKHGNATPESMVRRELLFAVSWVLVWAINVSSVKELCVNMGQWSISSGVNIDLFSALLGCNP